MQSQVIKESALFLNSSFKESVDEKGKKSYYIEAFIVPFSKKSRNGVVYNKKSIEKTHNDLVGKPVMFNHVTDGVEAISRGEWIETWCDDKGMHGRARIYNTKYNESLIEYLKEASNPAVSLQIQGEATRKKETDSDKYYTEAVISEWLECSVIGGVQGFKDATIKNFEIAIAEAFKSKEIVVESLEESIKPGKYTTKDGETITVHSVDGNTAVISGNDSKNKSIDVDALKHIIESFSEAQKPVDILHDLEKGTMTAKDALVRLKPFLKESLEEEKIVEENLFRKLDKIREDLKYI